MPGPETVRIAPARLIAARQARPCTIRCSDDDRLHEFLVVPLAFFYPHRLDEAALVDGLVAVLDRDPVWAGRARSPEGPIDIECDNSGVSFSTAEVDLTLREAVAAASDDAPWLIDTIDPLRVRTGRTALLTVRLIHLADGASVIGVCLHRAIGDAGAGFTMFRAWSAAVDKRPIVTAPLIEDRAAYLDAHVPPGSDRPSLRQIGPDDQAAIRRLLIDDQAKAAIRIHFSGPELLRMQKALSTRAGQRVSAVNALCGHLMGLITEYDEPGDGEWGVCVTADFRTAAGLDPTLSGNLASYPWFPVHRGDDPAQMARTLRDIARTLGRDHLHHHANRRLVASLGGPAALSRVIPEGIDPLRRILAFNDRSGLGAYDVSFGGETPVYVAFPSRRNLPWTSHVSQAGRRPTGSIAPLLFTAHLPPALVAALSSPERRQHLHAFAEATDPPPPEPAAAIPDLL